MARQNQIQIPRLHSFHVNRKCISKIFFIPCHRIALHLIACRPMTLTRRPRPHVPVFQQPPPSPGNIPQPRGNPARHVIMVARHAYIGAEFPSSLQRSIQERRFSTRSPVKHTKSGFSHSPGPRSPQYHGRLVVQIVMCASRCVAHLSDAQGLRLQPLRSSSSVAHRQQRCSANASRKKTPPMNFAP